MASIGLTDDHSWVVANWVFRHLVEEVLSRWDDDCAAKRVLAHSLESHLFSFAAGELGESGKARFCRYAAAIYEQLERAEPSEFATREGYEGLKARIGDLVTSMNQLGWLD